MLDAMDSARAYSLRASLTMDSICIMGSLPLAAKADNIREVTQRIRAVVADIHKENRTGQLDVRFTLRFGKFQCSSVEWKWCSVFHRETIDHGEQIILDALHRQLDEFRKHNGHDGCIHCVTEFWRGEIVNVEPGVRWNI